MQRTPRRPGFTEKPCENSAGPEGSCNRIRNDLMRALFKPGPTFLKGFSRCKQQPRRSMRLNEACTPIVRARQARRCPADISDLSGAGTDDCAGRILERGQFQLSQLRRHPNFLWKFDGGAGTYLEGHYVGRHHLFLRILASAWMWWSHMLDCQLFGLNAGLHHLVNLAFHVANTLLVFEIFRRMTGMVWPERGGGGIVWIASTAC